MTSRSSLHVWWWLAAAFLTVAVGAGPVVTRLMSLHMLVQIPMLLMAGLFAEQAYRLRRRDAEVQNLTDHRWSMNEYGIPGLIWVSLVSMIWMIPKALDDALVDWRMAAFKYIGMPVSGWLLGASIRRAPTIVKLFFLGNFCWMSAIAGLIYLEQPARLCNAYLLSDQDWTGRGLIALAILIPLAWLAWHARSHRRTNIILQ